MLQGLLAFLALAISGPMAPSLAAQTVRGTLMDLNTDQPIELGLVMMFTESGDSVGMTVTDERGRFTLSSPDPGAFILLASALGYGETPAGVFELGEDGVIDVQYRLAPEPLPVDELVVSLDRPVLQHRLVRNGFVRRLQRGLGHFVTPHDIEESSARSTEDLLVHVPGVRVADVRISREVAGNLTSEEVARGGTSERESRTVYPRPDIGQTVQIRSHDGGWCTPTVYVDGVRTFYTTDNTSYAQAVTLSTVAPLASMEAIEVYRRPAEIPPEYGFGGSGPGGSCGVLVMWTTSGPAAGQRATAGERRAASEVASLPSVERRGPPPGPGEAIRMQVGAEARERLGLTSPWEGTFLMVRDGELIANDVTAGRAVAVPVGQVEALQVRRDRSAGHAVFRGAVAGTAFAVGMWQFLKILCRSACEGGLRSAWFPAAVSGAGVGVLVGLQGPGQHWVGARLPEPGPSPDPTGATLPSRIPTRRR